MKAASTSICTGERELDALVGPTVAENHSFYGVFGDATGEKTSITDGRAGFENPAEDIGFGEQFRSRASFADAASRR